MARTSKRIRSSIPGFKARVALANRARVLLRAAAEARRLAVAPYSRFKVGAALLGANGVVITGANVESASYGLTCCAERVVLFKALTDGHSGFVAIAVVARAPGGPMPCGACRQLLAEYAPEAVVWVADSGALEHARSFSVAELIPGAFLNFSAEPAPASSTWRARKSSPQKMSDPAGSRL